MTGGTSTELARIELGRPDHPAVIFAHGWDRRGEDFRAVAELVADRARAVLLDLPGFGDSPRPPDRWGTEDYARFLRQYIADELGYTSFIWVGHSFGGRVGLRLAAMADSPVSDLVIVAGAGLKLPQPWWEVLRGRVRSQMFRLKRRPDLGESALIALERQYGSADYVRSRETGMRDIFLETVNEDQSESVGDIRCPTTLIYGALDTEAPPVIGRMLHERIASSSYVECPAFDHSTILTRGRHQVALAVREALARRAGDESS